jgi:protein SCO1/2
MTSSSSTRQYLALIAILAVIAIVAWLVIKQSPFKQPAFQAPPATILPEPRTLGGFSLRDQNNQVFNADSFKGHWNFVFFGYTHCPDVCPNTMVVFNIIKQELDKTLGKDNNVRFVLVSVDPERDTVEEMAAYTDYFNKDFIGVTGKPEEVMKLSRQIGIVYVRSSESPDKKYYLVDHTASIMLVDPQGSWYAVYSAPHDPVAISDSFKKIYKQEK